MSKILVTGGAGYIGSHVANTLLDAGHEVAIIDDLSSGKMQNLPQQAKFFEGDFSDSSLLSKIFSQGYKDFIVHLAASIEVGESVEFPEKYLNNNFTKTLALLNRISRENGSKIIFSSTAAVYGLQDKIPISEDAQTLPLDPYGHSKLMAEEAIKFYAKFLGVNAVIFRYFNACGKNKANPVKSTHVSHLLTSVELVASGKEPILNIFGRDYATRDGTCIRDYVHVMDIAEAHVSAIEHLKKAPNGYQIYNIGSGKGFSVLEIISEVENYLGREIPKHFTERRAGDNTAAVADASKALSDLNFSCRHSSLANIIDSIFSEHKNI